MVGDGAASNGLTDLDRTHPTAISAGPPDSPGGFMSLRRFILVLLSVIAVVTASGALAQVLPDNPQLYCIVAIEGMPSATAAFGFHPDAVLGRDERDLPAPPLPPSDYLAVHFALPAVTDPYPNRWLTDFRNTEDFADRSEQWDVTICTDRIGARAVLTITHLAAVHWPLEATVTGLGAKDVLLPIPGSIPFTVTADEMPFRIQVDQSVTPTAPETWGRVKNLFR